MSSRKLTFLSLLSAATIAGRIFFQFLPNVQPVTAILIFTAIYIGTIDAILVNIVIIFISNLFLGFGIWTFYQILSYSIIILIVALLKLNKYFREKIIIQAIFSFSSGFLYGFVISIFSALSFTKVNNFWAYLLAGIPFDFAHALGNFIIYIILIPVILKIKKHYFSKEPIF